MTLNLALDSVTTLAEPMVQRSRMGTLLVVDDEETVRQSLRVIFKDDYHVLMAGDGATAIELAQKTEVDVAILDVKMAKKQCASRCGSSSRMIITFSWPGMAPPRSSWPRRPRWMWQSSTSRWRSCPASRCWSA